MSDTPHRVRGRSNLQRLFWSTFCVLSRNDLSVLQPARRRAIGLSPQCYITRLVALEFQ